MEDAVVRRQTCQHNLTSVDFTQVGVQANGSLTVVFKEGRVTVYFPMDTFANNPSVSRNIQARVEGCTRCSFKDSPVNGTSTTMSTGISEPMSGW
jgi:hypothetical protein